MGDLFLSVLNMSLTASYVILFVIFVRLLLKKAPKVVSYALWGVVAFRLIIPFSFESMFSLMPRYTNTVPIPHDIIYQQSPQINSGIEVVDSFVNESLPAPTVVASVNPLQIWVEIGAYIWVFGVIALLVYSLISIFVLKRKLKIAQLIEKNIFEVKNLKTPFVLGLIRPKIYLPFVLNPEERNYILLHEQTHIHRKDHIIKIVAFLLLSIHWFNPLVWIAFILMSSDMELSCDEQVLREMDEDIKKPYATSLLNLAIGRHILNGSPLAFGEGNVKGRIKNVLNYKRPRFWVIIISIIILTVVGMGLISNPKVRDEHKTLLEPIAAEWSYDQNMGADFPSLDYASDDIVIYHGYFGLFVYDLKSQQLIRSLNLVPIDCQATQGDNFCDVSVSADGNIVQLHPATSENMYVLTISDNTLTEAPFQPMENQFDGLVSITDVMDSNKIGNCSFNAVKFDNGEFGYLQASNWIVGSLTYVRGNMLYSLFDKITQDQTTSNMAYRLLDKTTQDQTGIDVENNLAIIISSPKTSSNPQDYITAHKNEYEYFMKYGGEDALQYMLSQFEAGNAEGLRGQIMMILCKELLGARNNVNDESLSPQEWYNALSIRLEIKLPNYEYDGQDPVEKLVYDTEINKNSDSNSGGFIVVAPKIFGSYEEENLLKVFTTTYSARYKLYGNTLSLEGASVVPVAITYRKDNSGGYILEKYEQARDGSKFAPSIRKYCTMPASKKEIKGLADKILKHYGDYEDIRALMQANLYKHLKNNGITDATLEK